MLPFPFDSVLFDLDGTLVATDRYWPDAARKATRAFLADQGIEHAIPSTARWMEMVGLPLAESFDVTFAELEPAVRRALMGACIDEEHRLLARGQAALLPGVKETLNSFRGQGVKMGVASNCGDDYLDVMMNGLGLSKWIAEGRCLASRGIGNKADMIEDLLLTFGSRSAVMVGDRSGDRNSAWANGIPHVHIPRGYGGVREVVEAEAVLDGMDQLEVTLRQRAACVDNVLEGAGANGVIAISGMPLAGKTLFARDLERGARAAGKALEVQDGPAEAAAFAHRVHLVCGTDVLVRRAKGKRAGMAPVQALMDTLNAPAPERGSAQVIDMTNALAPSFSPRD